MWRDKDAENSNIDNRNDYSSTDLQLACRGLALGDDRNTIDDDLHQELNLKDIEKEDKEEKGRSKDKISLALDFKIGMTACLPIMEDIFEPEPAEDCEDKICEYLAPYHVNISGSPGILVSPGLMEGSDCCQETKADGEASCTSSDLVVTRRRHVWWRLEQYECSEGEPRSYLVFCGIGPW
jgi:hypothetical protein